MSNLQLPNPATFAQRVAAIEQALSGALTQAPVASLVVTGGAAGDYTYVVVAKYPPLTVPSAAVSTTAGPTNLGANNFNTISWTPAPAIAEGNIQPVYDVYRTAGGATQGKIASNISATTSQNNPVALSIVDNGLVADGSIAPAFNTSGLLTGAVQELVVSYAAAAAIAIGAGVVVLDGGAAQAMTLAKPVAGTDDGKRLTILSTSAFAHTVTTPAAGLNGTDHILTFTAAAGNFAQLVAFNGSWWLLAQLNGTLS